MIYRKYAAGSQKLNQLCAKRMAALYDGTIKLLLIMPEDMHQIQLQSLEQEKIM